MKNPDFPIFLTQLNIKEMPYFMFTLPEQEFGRNDIQIFVEYAVTEDKSTVVFDAWAQFKNTSVRARVYNGTIPFMENDSVIANIVSNMNLSDKFRSTMRHFVVHFG